MKIKKILSLLIAAVFVCAAFAGCSDGTKAKYTILEENFGSEEFSIGFRKTDGALAQKVQEILDAIYSDGKGKEISTKWFGSDVILKGNDYPTAFEVAEDDNSLQYILDKGEIILGLDDSFPPMGYRDEGKIVGFDIDLATEMAERLGVKLTLQSIDWSAKEMELNGNKIDMIWNGMSITEERKESMILSKPYLANAQIILVAEGSEIKTKADLAGKKVGVQAGSSALDAINSEPDVVATFGSLEEYPDNNAAFLDLKAGRIDALVGDKTYIEYIIAHQ